MPLGRCFHAKEEMFVKCSLITVFNLMCDVCYRVCVIFSLGGLGVPEKAADLRNWSKYSKMASVVLNEFRDEFEQKCTDCSPKMSKFIVP